MDPPIPFPPELREVIDSVKWTYARTMPTWPHEYTLRKRVKNDLLFNKICIHIKHYGYYGRFYKYRRIYFEEDGLIYWTMGWPVAETEVINRAKIENSYDYRLAHGTLPK